MTWLLSPAGIAVVVILIVAIASLIYWKRKPIKKWLATHKVGWKLKAGPVEMSLEEKDKPGAKQQRQAGVDFGEGTDLTGASLRGVAGRDIRRGAAAAESAGGQTPGVDFGKKAKLRDAEIEDVAGRDSVEE